MTYDRTRLTLGELLTSDDVTIKRNAMSILKTLSGCDHTPDESRRCIYCFKPISDDKMKCIACGNTTAECICIP